MTWWALIDADGRVRGQVETDGISPAEDGSNPDGLEEVRIARPRDLAAEEWNPATRRWKKRDRPARDDRRARRWLERLPDGVIDALADAVAARLKERGDG